MSDPSEWGAVPAGSLPRSEEQPNFGARQVEGFQVTPGTATSPTRIKPAPAWYEQAIKPITDYPEVYSQMNQEARDQMSRGISQLSSGEGTWDTVKGLGNVGLGALDYTMSPVNAAIRSVAGQPIENVTGIPKEYTEFATSLAIPSPKVPHAPPALQPLSHADEVIRAGERQGVEVPRAVVSGDNMQRLAGGLKETFGVGVPLVNAARRAREQINNAIEGLYQRYGSGNLIGAGQAVKKGMADWVNVGSKATADRVYNSAERLIDQQRIRPLHATQSEVANIMAQRLNSKQDPGSPVTDLVANAITSPGLNYRGLKDLREAIGERLRGQTINETDTSTKELRRVYKALTEDLRGLALDHGGPDGLRAFDRANEIEKQIVNRRTEIAHIIGAKADAPPEAIIDGLLGIAGSKKGADIKALADARKAAGQQAWDEMASAVIARMGRDREGNFSAERFLTQLGSFDKRSQQGLSPQAKRILFSGGNGEMYAALKDIALLSSKDAALQRLGNPSGTYRTGSVGAMLTGLVTHPLLTLTGVVGGAAMSKYLANPATAKGMAQWSRAYAKAQMAPTISALNNLNKASHGLALVAERDLGEDADALLTKLNKAATDLMTRRN